MQWKKKLSWKATVHCPTWASCCAPAARCSKLRAAGCGRTAAGEGRNRVSHACCGRRGNGRSRRSPGFGEIMLKDRFPLQARGRRAAATPPLPGRGLLLPHARLSAGLGFPPLPAPSYQHPSPPPIFSPRSNETRIKQPTNQPKIHLTNSKRKRLLVAPSKSKPTSLRVFSFLRVETGAIRRRSCRAVPVPVSIAPRLHYTAAGPCSGSPGQSVLEEALAAHGQGQNWSWEKTVAPSRGSI